MDGFNVIPVDKDVAKSGPTSTNMPLNAGSLISDANFEIEDQTSPKNNESVPGSSLLLVLSVMTLIGIFGYFGFLVYQRVIILAQISDYSIQIAAIGQKIDVKEMQEFQAMDNTLRTINDKLSKHVLSSYIFATVNKNIRTSLQITEYKMTVGDKEIDATMTAVAPTFKELAEQSEKFIEMKSIGTIKSFTISNLTFEPETKRARFTVQLLFDKSKYSASNFNNQNTN